MTISKKSKYFFSFLIIILSFSARAQEIRDKKISATTGEEIFIKFMSQPAADLTPDQARNEYDLSGLNTGLLIKAKIKNAKPAKLIVTEGKRTHIFLISYSDQLENNFFDFSSAKLLEQAVREPKGTNNTETTKTIATETSAKGTADEKYISLVKEGNDEFKKEMYDEAQASFQKALLLVPADDYANDRLKEIEQKLSEKKQKEQKGLDEKYTNAILKAAKAFSQKKYEEAKTAYKEALTYRLNDQFALNNILSIDKTISQEALAAKQIEERRQHQEMYKATIANADKAFLAMQYDDAKTYYTLATTLSPDETYPKNKLKETEKKISHLSKEKEQQEIEIKRKKEITNAFDEAVTLGDNAFKAENYTIAKAEYNKALKLKKDQEVENQVKKTDELLLELNQKKLTQKEKEQKELLKTENYEKTIAKADKAFTNKDYASARIFYKQALNYKDEQYAKDKLSETEALVSKLELQEKAGKEKMAEADKTNKKYNAAIAKGKTFLAAEDFINAKAAYKEAADLKPAEPEPQTKLIAINKKTEELVKNQDYDSTIAEGNIAISEKNYKLAIEYFKKALRSKPSNTYPLNQLQFAESLVLRDSLATAEKQRKKEVHINEEERKNRFNQGMTAYMNYENAAQMANYENQLLFLKQFLNIIPDASELNEYQANFAGKIDFANKKIKTIRDYLTRIKGNSYQPEAIPYTNLELKSKYSNINFSKPPADQLFEQTDSTKLNESIKISKEVLAEKPRLSLSDSSDNIKLTCQSISFKGENAYLKFCVRNNSISDFPSGQMQLSVIKKDKSVINLRPEFISDFPIVLPQKEFFIVYVTKANKINNSDDQISLEIKDVFKNKKIKINIPGKVFNQEKSRQS